MASKIALVLPSNILTDASVYLYHVNRLLKQYAETGLSIDLIIPGEKSKNLFFDSVSQLADCVCIADRHIYDYAWSNAALHSPLDLYHFILSSDYIEVMSFDTCADTFFCIYSKSINYEFLSTTFTVIPVQPLWFSHLNNGRMIESPVTVTMAAMEYFVIRNADILIGQQSIISTIYSGVFSGKNISCARAGVLDSKPHVEERLLLYWGCGSDVLGVADFVKAISMLDIECRVGFVLTDSANEQNILDISAKYHIASKVDFIICDRQAHAYRSIVESAVFCYFPNFISYLGLLSVVPSPDFSILAAAPLLLRGAFDDHYCINYPNAHKLCEKIRCALSGKSLQLQGVIYDLMAHDRYANPNKSVGHTLETPAESEPLVTVCIVHYNRPELLRNALTSILNQNYKNIEIIISDDGSSSDVVSQIERMIYIDMCLNEDMISVIKSENSYLGAARNRAIAHAKGKYIFFMDDDNEAMSNELHTLVKIAILNEDALFVGSFMAVCEVSDNGEMSWDGRNIFAGIGCNNIAGMIENNFSDANGLYDIEKLSTLGGFSEDYGLGYEDWELFYKAQKNNMKVIIVPEPLYYYRVNAGDSMARDHTSTTINMIRVARVIFQKGICFKDNECFFNMLLMQGMYFKEI